MRRIALGSALIAATAALSVPVIGLAGDTGPQGTWRFRTPVAAAEDDLPAFKDCEQLLDWYVEQALPMVGPWGFGSPYYPYFERPGLIGDLVWAGRDMAMQRAAAPTAAMGVRNLSAELDKAPAYNSDSGTNVQEAGVDEPDVAKTDGKLIVRVERHKLLVTDITGDEAKNISSTDLPRRFHGTDLMLAGDRVLIIGNDSPRYYMTKVFDYGYGYGTTNSKVVTYSIADPGKPELVDEQELEGAVVEARQYGDTMRLVLQTGAPELDFVVPNRRRTEREARQENRDIVRDSAIEDWLPSVVRDGKRTPLVECSDVRHPRTDSGFGTISIVTFDATTPVDTRAVAVTTSGDLAYSSLDRLYVATPVVPRAERPWIGERLCCGPRRVVSQPARTEIHAFELDGMDTTYVASGTVDGSIKDRWSLDEHDGNLRVAVALMKDWTTTDNAITVLHQDGNKLKQVGSVRHLGPREDIQSVRWFDDLAILVTFRQVDPLYTVDLSDPTDPILRGKLKIPGFSSYLHPIGKDRLLGLGTAADLTGSTQGAQIATFDISDVEDPRQVSRLQLGEQDSLTAAEDPRAFSFVGDGTAFTTVNDWNGHNRIIRLKVSSTGDLSLLDEYPSRYNTRILPIDGDRVAFVGTVVRLVDLG